MNCTHIQKRSWPDTITTLALLEIRMLVKVLIPYNRAGHRSLRINILPPPTRAHIRLYTLRSFPLTPLIQPEEPTFGGDNGIL